MKKYILAGLAGILFTARSVGAMDLTPLIAAHGANTGLAALVVTFFAHLREQELNANHRRAIDALREQLDGEHAQAIQKLQEQLDRVGRVNEQEGGRQEREQWGAGGPAAEELEDVFDGRYMLQDDPRANDLLRDRLAAQRAARAAMQRRFANLIEDMENRLIENFQARVRAYYRENRRRECLRQLDAIITEVCQSPGLRERDRDWVRRQYRQAAYITYVVRSGVLFQAVRAFFTAMIDDGVRGNALSKEAGDRLSNTVFMQTHQVALGQVAEGAGNVFVQDVSRHVDRAESICVQLEVWKQLNERVGELRDSGVVQGRCDELARLEAEHSEAHKAQFAREFNYAIAAIIIDHRLPAVG